VDDETYNEYIEREGENDRREVERERRAKHLSPESKKTLVYLATPYTDDDPYIMEKRFRRASTAAARLMQIGLHVFSPISHTHPIASLGGLPRGWEYWRQYDLAILSCCARMIVYKQPGWDRSKGVASEIAIAQKLGIPVEYMEDDREVDR